MSQNAVPIREELAGYMPEVLVLRRRIHARPETGWTEFETTALVVEKLTELGFEVACGREIVKPEAVLGRKAAEAEKAQERARQAGVSEAILRRMQGYTGAVGVWRTDRPGPVTALRFDIDALFVTEAKDPKHLPNELGCSSTFPGLMHACGHDCHTALGIGLAHWIHDHADRLCGTIKLIFQPAEEGTRGATAMAAAGVVDDVDNLIGSHIACGPRQGEITITDPGYNATVKFDAHFKGRPAHSVANPQDGRNALMTACHAAVLVGSLPRHGAGRTTCSVGRIVAGEMRNVVPENAVMEMEVRGATNELCDYEFSEVERAIKAAALAFEVDWHIDVVGRARTMAPTPSLAALLEKCAGETVGAEHVSHYSEKGGSEDVTVFMEAVQKHGGRAAHFYYGADTPAPNHSRNFDPDDKRSIPVGFEVMARALLSLNGTAGQVA